MYATRYDNRDMEKQQFEIADSPRILQVSRIESPISRHKPVESIEQVIMDLYDSMTKQGADISVAAPCDSQPYRDFNIMPTVDSFGEVYGADIEPAKEHVRDLHYRKAVEHAQSGNFDIVHDHYYLIKVPWIFDFLESNPEFPPILTTLHVPLGKNKVADRVKQASEYTSFLVVSESQRKIFMDELGIDGSRIYSIHNGIHPREFDFSDQKDDYLLSLGRINQDKGTRTACEVARASGRTLVISGYFNNTEAEHAYFRDEVEPHVDIQQDLSGISDKEAYQNTVRQLASENPGSIIYIGRSSPSQRKDLYRHSSGFLFMSGTENDWQEPFGLVQIEANASGTPVISYDSGAAREIIKPGVNGFISRDFEGMVKSAGSLENISPFACRRHVENNFTSDLAARRHMDLYDELVSMRKNYKP